MPVPRVFHLEVASAILVAAALVARVQAENTTCASAVGQDPPSCPGLWSPWFGGNSGKQICSMNATVLPEDCCGGLLYVTDFTASVGQANGITVGGVNNTAVNFIDAACNIKGQFDFSTLDSANPKCPKCPKWRLGWDNGFNTLSGRAGLVLDQFIANPQSTGGGAWKWSCPQGFKISGYQGARGYDVVVAVRFMCTNIEW